MHNLRLTFAILIVSFLSVHAWWDAGHMIVAEIARQSLSEETVAKVDTLLALEAGFFPDHSTLVPTAVWMDVMKERENSFGRALEEWHYLDIPYSLDGTAVPTEQQDVNIVSVLSRLATTMESETNAWAKVVAMRCIVHLLGDLHQPMHCVGGYSVNLPKGDLGGNLFKVFYNMSSKGEVFRNLHSVWDSMGGAYTGYAPRPMTDEYMQMIHDAATSIMADHPPPPAAALAGHPFMEWAQEGNEAAIEHAYLNGTLPFDSVLTDAYMANVAAVARGRVALAGYRLAALIESFDMELRGPLPAPTPDVVDEDPDGKAGGRAGNGVLIALTVCSTAFGLAALGVAFWSYTRARQTGYSEM